MAFSHFKYFNDYEFAYIILGTLKVKISKIFAPNAGIE